MWPLFLFVNSLGLNPIIIKGHMFFDSVTKERFYVRGVDYAPDVYGNTAVGGTTARSPPGTDHISDDANATWSRDINYLKQLHVNVVRIYDVDPAKSHDKFMAALAQNGIYALIAATRAVGPGVLNTYYPAPECYTTGLLVSAKQIVRAFAKYNNTLGIVVGNEVANAVQVKDEGGRTVAGVLSMPCIKALTRDLNAYMKSCNCGMRRLPLVYAATDLGEVTLATKGKVVLRQTISDYLTCGADSDAIVDGYGINIYTWCSKQSTFDKQSTYKQVTDAYAKYPMPLLFTEFGCNQGDYTSPYPFQQNQREWKDVAALLSPLMSDVFSGGFAYQYSMTENDYGLVLLPDYEANQKVIVPLPNYNYLAQQYAAARPPAYTGDWTDQNLCSWLPLGFAETKSKSVCPAADLLAELFRALNILNHTQNWIGTPLPPVPPNSDVECGQNDLSPGQELTNSCYGECHCQEMQTDSGCRSGFTDATPSQEVQDLFNRLCGLLANFGGRYNNTCNLISTGGRYGGCATSRKADYLLYVWGVLVKQGTECCSSLSTSTTCTKFSYCSELQTNSACLVDWKLATANVKQSFFDQMCFFLAKPLSNPCASFSSRYSDCTQERQANHLLTLWEQANNNEPGYCCATVGTPGTSVSSCSGELAACSSIIPNPRCRVETGAVDVKHLMDVQCGLFQQFGGPLYQNTCSILQPGYRYGACRPDQQADYALDIWYSKVKGGSECCANLLGSSDTACQSLDKCSTFQSNPGCNVSAASPAANLENLIALQCGFLYQYGGEWSGACQDINDTNPNALYSNCPLYVKANYILDIYYRAVKKGVECCASLLSQPGCASQSVTALSIATSADVSLFAGSSATLTVTASGGLPPYSYQWQLNGSNIYGAIEAGYSVNKFERILIGTYRCRVTDSLGNQLLSRSIVVSLVETPTGAPDDGGSNTGLIIGVCIGAGLLLIFGAAVSYKVYARKHEDDTHYDGSRTTKGVPYQPMQDTKS